MLREITKPLLLLWHHQYSLQFDNKDSQGDKRICKSYPDDGEAI